MNIINSSKNRDRLFTCIESCLLLLQLVVGGAQLNQLSLQGRREDHMTRVYLVELALLYTENSGGGMGGDQFSKVSRIKGICEATKQTMPISAVTTESANPVANIILLSGSSNIIFPPTVCIQHNT